MSKLSKQPAIAQTLAGGHPWLGLAAVMTQELNDYVMSSSVRYAEAASLMGASTSGERLRELEALFNFMATQTKFGWITVSLSVERVRDAIMSVIEPCQK